MFQLKLRELMAKRQVTVTELAKKSGIHYVQISGYLSGSAKGKLPNLKNLMALTVALRCSVEELTGIKTKPDLDNLIDDLSPEAREIAEKYDQLSDEDKRLYMDFLRRLVKNKP